MSHLVRFGPTHPKGGTVSSMDPKVGPCVGLVDLNNPMVAGSNRDRSPPPTDQDCFGKTCYRGTFAPYTTFGLKQSSNLRVEDPHREGSIPPYGRRGLPPSQHTSRLGSRHGIVMSTC